jgi:nitrile hydratase
MDGIHDLGGKSGFGKVVIEPNEPAFHARWEARLFPIIRAAMAAGARTSVDQFRHAIERIDPIAYLTHGYYGRWLGGIENLLVEGGVLTREEIDARVVARGGSPNDLVASRPSPNPDRASGPSEPSAYRGRARKPRFKDGASVITRTHAVPGHTRLPAYVRGRRGRIESEHGCWVYPDSVAHGRGEDPQPLYTVVFDGAELWGEGAEAGTTVRIDLFEPYLTADRKRTKK